MSTDQPNVLMPVRSDGTPILSLCLTNHGDIKVITVGGELDLDTAHLLTELVDRVADQRPARLVIDMADVTLLCAAGLSALLRARETIAAVGGRLVLLAPSAATQKTLAITDTERVFEYDTATATI
jgi:anti-sigma B factor antagonist